MRTGQPAVGARKITFDWGGTSIDLGVTLAPGRPTERVAVTGDAPGLARSKASIEPTSEVFCANCHEVDRSGEPRRSERPGLPVCCSSSLTRAPESADTIVAIAGTFCT